MTQSRYDYTLADELLLKRTPFSEVARQTGFSKDTISHRARRVLKIDRRAEILAEQEAKRSQILEIMKSGTSFKEISEAHGIRVGVLRVWACRYGISKRPTPFRDISYADEPRQYPDYLSAARAEKARVIGIYGEEKARELYG
jgi:uncharacterized protein YerC